ncbi:MAG TPA: alpha-glucosidase [Acidobacteriaceae bacterium]|jgi:alpha-glucosidase|nr:alpha-glucosidase [Acidobacteriaceae bacterium]
MKTPTFSLLLSAALATILAPHTLAQTASVPPTAAELRAAAAPTQDAAWWKHAVLYEIYPRSFQDSHADGIGDLNGIDRRLDYLQHLGVNAIWIAPMYPSPQVDFGYDISNYEAVDPQYGTLADFDHLLRDAKQHNIRILLDMVLNHTSDQHPWFIESASSRTNPKADWYCWNDGIPASTPNLSITQRHNVHNGPHGPVVPPNNWVSLFGGSAWQWVPARRQFYYHKFYRQQPDLNWRNPAVEKAMFAAMRFWLDRGVAGFRLDAIPTLFEDPQLRNEPVAAPGLNAQGDPILNDIYTNMLPGVHGVLRRMRAMTDTYSADKYPGPRVLIGETYLPTTADLLAWYGTPAHPELQLPMDMLLGFHTEGGGPNGANTTLNLGHFRRAITSAETELDGHQPLFVFDNHDNPRSWDRFTIPSETFAQKLAIAKLLASVLLTTRSTALMYYGEEIGMATHIPTRKQDVRDPIGITGWPREKGRDGERTPMQWSAAPQAGFSTDPHTWLPVGSDYKTINVATESADPNSLLSWYKTLIAIRRLNPTMHDGGIIMLDNTNPSVLSYVRTSSDKSKFVLVSMNMTNKPQQVNLDEHPPMFHTYSVKTLLTDAPELEHMTTMRVFTLPPFASFLAEIQQQQ